MKENTYVVTEAMNPAKSAQLAEMFCLNGFSHFSADYLLEQCLAATP